MTNDLRKEIAQIIIELGAGDVHEVHAATTSILAKLDPDALAHPVRVKPLVWEGHEDDCFITCDMRSTGYDICVIDTLERSCDYIWRASFRENGQHDIILGGGTLEEAKAAAQADHEARIRATIEPAVAPDPDALIVAALEAAAKAGGLAAVNWVNGDTTDQEAAGGIYLHSHDAIRALAADPEARAAIKAKAGWSE